MIKGKERGEKKKEFSKETCSKISKQYFIAFLHIKK